MGYAVDLGELDFLVGQLGAVAERLQERVTAVDERVIDLHVSWSGGAAEAHLAAHERWLDSQRRMHAAVTTLHGIALDAHHNYSGAVTANSAMWRL
jgi:uncharacterized protein YukE